MTLDLLGSDQQFTSNQTRGVGTKCIGTKQLRLELALSFEKRDKNKSIDGNFTIGILDTSLQNFEQINLNQHARVLYFDKKVV